MCLWGGPRVGLRAAHPARRYCHLWIKPPRINERLIGEGYEASRIRWGVAGCGGQACCGCSIKGGGVIRYPCDWSLPMGLLVLACGYQFTNGLLPQSDASLLLISS